MLAGAHKDDSCSFVESFPLGSSSRLENLINMCATIFVRGFQVVQLFLQIRYLRCELPCLAG